MGLIIPSLTINDNFRLSDFQNDFNYIMDSIASHAKNAREYGITGNISDDNTVKIQELLNEAGNIYFPKGIYKLTAMLNVYSNTHIIAHPEAVFIRYHDGVMFQTATTTETLLYNGQKNIRFYGGSFNHNENYGPSNIFTLFHCDNVILSDIVLLNTVGAHAVDIVGSQNIVITNCKFKGYKAIMALADVNKEAIQIDTASANSYPIYTASANAYDGTVTQNVVISTCEFGPSDTLPSYPTAIGQHGQIAGKSRYKNIRVINNKLLGDTRYTWSIGIRPISWENSIISGNHIEGYRGGIMVELLETVYDPKGNQLRGTGTPITAADEATLFVGTKGLVINDNIIASADASYPRAGIWFNTAGANLTGSGANAPKHRDINLTGNIIYLSGTLKQLAIDMDTTETANITGNTFVGNTNSTSVGVQCLEYCKDITIGRNAYKGIARDNEHFAHSTCLNVRKQGLNQLWTGVFYNGKMQSDGTNLANGQIITLSDSIDNYDYLLIEASVWGNEIRPVDFKLGNTQTIRLFNLSDAGNVGTYNLAEWVFVKTSPTTLEMTVSKNMILPAGTLGVNSTSYYIKTITGVNH